MSDDQALLDELSATIRSDMRVAFAAELEAGAELTPELRERLTKVLQSSVATLAECSPDNVTIDVIAGTVRIHLDCRLPASIEPLTLGARRKRTSS